MNILDIYKNYTIPQNLQTHMLRVAGLGYLICQSLTSAVVNIELITKALLIHDMANILKFDFSNREMLDPTDQKRVPELIKIQNEYRRKYGDDIDTAILLIASEITKDTTVISLIKNSHWENTKKISSVSNSWEEKICIYSDVRIGPFGILSLKKRYENLMLRVTPEAKIKLERQIPYAEEIERQIQSKCSINLTEITDVDLEAQFDTLKQTTII